jgi:hypothetical protein
MSKESMVFFLGLLLLVMPFLGIPDSYKTTGQLFAALVLIFVGYRLRRRAFLDRIKTAGGERRADSFSEHGHDQPTLPSL